MSWHHHRQQQQQAQPQQQQQQPNPYAQQVHQTTGLPPSVQAAYAAAAEAQDEAERFAAGLPIAHHGTHHHAELLLNYHQQQQAQEQRELRELQEQQYAQQQQQQQAAAEEEEQQRQQQALLLQYQQQREGSLSQPTASTWNEEAAAASAVAAAPTAASLVAAAREAAGYVPTADPLGRTGSREDEDADVHALIREMDGGHGVAAASAVAASASTPGTAVAKTRKRGPNKRRKALPKAAQQQKQQKQQPPTPALPPQAVQPPQAAPRIQPTQPTPPVQEKAQRVPVPVQEPPKQQEQPRPAPPPPPAPAPYVQPLTPGGRARKRYDDALIDHSAAAREYADAKKRLDEAQARFEAASTREVETSKALRHTVEECTPDLLKNDHGDFLSNRHSEKNEKRRKWNEMYHSLAAFHTLHGHCLVPRNDPEKNPDEKISPHMAKLGQWVFAQRAAYRKHRERQLKSSDAAGADEGTTDEDGDGLEMYQRIALERLGFDFEPHANRWQSKYDELKAFCDEHGCGVVNLHPELKRQPEGSPERERLEALHRWVQMQTQLFRSLQKGKPSDGTGNLSQERIDMLTSLDPSIFDPKEAAWMDKYRQLRKFRDDHGHADVNPEIHGEQYASLYAWVNTQATQYRKLQKLGEEKANVKLTVERIKRLDELGMRWKERTPKQDKTWKKMYDQLKEYKDMYGHCYVPQDYPLNPELGFWVLDQRREYGKIKRSKSARRSTSIMSMDRLQALDDLEFEWERGVDEDDEELSRLRKQDGVRGDEKAAKEDVEAIEWEDLDWDGYYSNLARLKEEYGDTFLPVLENENEHVRLWAEEQRTRYKEFKYPSQENETKGKKGKDGSGKKTPSKRKRRDEDDDGESEAQGEKDSDDEDGDALWLERLEKLTKIGFMFDEDDVVAGVTVSPKMQRWNELFRDLLKNKMEEGTFFVPKKEPTLRCWAQELRREYVKAARGKKTNLTAEQIRRLDQVKSYSSWALWGKKWSSDVKTWNDRLTDLMVYRINHSTFDVDKELDEDLHDWVLMQQLTKAKKELDPRRAEKLKRIGLDFAKMERDRRKHEEKRRRQSEEKKKKEQDKRKKEDERKKKAKREQEEKKKKAKQQAERKKRAARREPEPVAPAPKKQKRGRGRPRKSEAKEEEKSPAATSTGTAGNPPMPWGYGPMPRPMPGPVPWPYQGMMYGPSPQYYGMYNAVPPQQQPVTGSPTSSGRGRKRMVGSYLLRGTPPSGEQTAETPPKASSKDENDGQTGDDEAKDNQEETAASSVNAVKVDSKATDDSEQSEDKKDKEPNATEASGESGTAKGNVGGNEEGATTVGDATEGTKPEHAEGEVKAVHGESKGVEQDGKGEEGKAGKSMEGKGSSEDGAKVDKGKSDDVVFI